MDYGKPMAARATRRDLLHDALALSVEDRAELAAELLASLEGPSNANAPQGWTDEVRGRIDGVLDGTVVGIPADEFLMKLRRRIGL
jgi:hypothetical protein